MTHESVCFASRQVRGKQKASPPTDNAYSVVTHLADWLIKTEVLCTPPGEHRKICITLAKKRAFIKHSNNQRVMRKSQSEFDSASLIISNFCDSPSIILQLLQDCIRAIHLSPSCPVIAFIPNFFQVRNPMSIDIEVL